MKCMSCDLEINPKWKHAIDMNSCPFCGQVIMDENIKNSFQILSEAMNELKDHPDQLNDWMLANHNYIKADSSLILRKRRNESEIEVDETRPGVNNKFIEKTNKLRAKKEESYKDLVNEMKSGEPMPSFSEMMKMDDNQFSQMEQELAPEDQYIQNQDDDGVDNHIFAKMQSIKKGGANSKDAADMARLNELQRKHSSSRGNLLDAPDDNPNRIRRSG